MNSEKHTIDLPTYDPAMHKQQERRGRWRWWHVLLLSGAIGLFTYSQTDNITRLKNYLTGESEQGVLDMGFPPQVANMQGPDELNTFMQQLQTMFGEEDCHHHHHRHNQDHITECDAQQNAHCGKLSIAFPPEYARHPRPPRRHETFCKPEELISSSNVLTFSPEEFQRTAVYLDGPFSHGGYVTVDKATDSEAQDIKVNVTTYVGRKELQDQVSVGGFDHEGQYSVQVKRKGGHHHRKPPVKEDCVTYTIHVVFPSHLETYEDLDLHIKMALRIQSTPELDTLTFDKFRAGVGHGAIVFSDLKAKTIQLGALYGVVMGDYSPSEKFVSAAVHGVSKVKIHPASEHVSVTSAAVVGPASAELPADEFKGNFLVGTWTGTPVIEAPNPEDVHVVKNKYTFKAGYYKERDTGSNVVVHSKHGDSELLFK